MLAKVGGGGVEGERGRPLQPIKDTIGLGSKKPAKME